MAAVTIPSGAVERRAGDPYDVRLGQVNLASGKVVRIDTSNANKFNLADKDLATTYQAYGVTTNTTDAGEDAVAALGGSLITVASSAFTQGVPYFLGDDGTFVPYGDLVSGDYVVYLGVAASATTLYFDPHVTGATIP